MPNPLSFKYERGVTLIEILVAVSLINGCIVLCLGDAVHRQKILSVYYQHIHAYQQRVNQQEACHVA